MTRGHNVRTVSGQACNDKPEKDTSNDSTMGARQEIEMTITERVDTKQSWHDGNSNQLNGRKLAQCHNITVHKAVKPSALTSTS